MADLRSALNPRDAAVINASGNNSWVPKDPIDLLLPYIDKQKVLPTELDKRQNKAHKIVKEYEKLEAKSLDLCAIIEEKCKNVVVKLDPSNRLRVIEAVRRAFGTEGDQITFEMYKLAIKKQVELSNKDIPKPVAGGKNDGI